MKEDVNAKLLRQVESWYRVIASHLAIQQPDYTALQLNCTTQRLINHLLCLYLCEQRGIIPFRQLRNLVRGRTGSIAYLYARITQLLHQLNRRLGTPLLAALPPDLAIADDLLHSILSSLYAPDLDQFAAVSIQILGQVYETFLGRSIAINSDRQVIVTHTAEARKSGGIYYTPSAIVSYILQRTLGTLLPSAPAPSSALPSFPRLLDPACGGGAFLLAAYQFLLDWHLQICQANLAANPVEQYAPAGQHSPHQEGEWRLPYLERQQILLTHIYGVDIDPQAVAVTQLSLGLKLLEGAPAHQPLLDLSQNIQCGNAVLGPDFYDLFPARSLAEDTAAEPCPINPFDWEKAFPEILQAGGFDVVVGNPPYLDSEWMSRYLPNWRRYCTTHYRTAVGNWDIFCVFIEKALELCRSQGLTSMVVPNKLTSAGYASKARSLLAEENQLLSIRDYSQVSVFSAAVYPLVYVAQKQPPQPESIVCYEQMQQLDQVSCSYQLNFCRRSTEPAPSWLVAKPQQFNLMSRLQQGFPALSALAEVTGAATVAEAYALQPLIRDQKAESGDLRLVNSGTIDRYQMLWGKKPFRYLGKSYLHPIISSSDTKALPLKRQQQANQPKIIVAGMSQQLECAFDRSGSVLAGKSTSIIRWVPPDANSDAPSLDLRYLLGLLNSRLISFYFTNCFEGNRLQGGYFRVGPPQLRQLPICLPDFNNPLDQQAHDQIIALVKWRLRSPELASTLIKQPIDRTDQEIDRLVYQLYRLSNAEIEEISNLAIG